MVFEGFVKRIWANLGVEKVTRLENNHFIVSFIDVSARDRVVELGMWFFDRKPLVVRPWTRDLDALKGVKYVPVWVKLPRLPVKYWNENSLSAIRSLLGTPLLTDKITKDRQWLNFVRILIEMEIGTELTMKIQFVNEYG